MQLHDILVLVSLSTLTACSPYLYKDEIAGVSSAATSIGTSWKGGQAALAGDYQAIVIERASWNGSPAKLKGACVFIPDILSDGDKLEAEFKTQLDAGNFDLGGTTCAIDIGNRAVASPPPIVSDDTKKSIDETIAALSAYASALLAITNAADKDALTKAAASANTAVGKTADAAGKLGATSTEVASVKAGASFFTDIVGLVLDHQRYKVLRQNVLAVDPLMPTLAGKLADNVDLVRTARLPILAQRVTLETVEYNSGSSARSNTDNQVLLTALQAQAANYDALNSANASAVKKLATAHHELADALRNDKGQSSEVFTAVMTLANDMEQFSSALSSTSAKPAPAATGKTGK